MLAGKAVLWWTTTATLCPLEDPGQIEMKVGFATNGEKALAEGRFEAGASDDVPKPVDIEWLRSLLRVRLHCWK